MRDRTRDAQRSLALWVGAALLSAPGCSADDGVGRRYPVSGTVKYKGEPVAKGLISFVPVKDGPNHGAFGEIEDGSFSLTTLTPIDGALPGEYKVIIDARQVDEDQLQAEAAKLAAEHGMPNLKKIPAYLRAKAMKNASNSIPEKYQSTETSDLAATVKEQTNHLNFELKD